MTEVIRILIIEDQEQDVELILARFELSGFPVAWDCVDSALELEWALSHSSWDVVLSDFRMPGFNALKALEIVKKTGKDIPFVIVSGEIGEDQAVEAMRVGARDFVRKDNLGRLIPVVERELREVEVRKHLLETERRFRLVIDGVQDYAIYTLDSHGRISSWNAGAERIKGWKAEEVLGRYCSILYPKEAVLAKYPDLELKLARERGRHAEEGWRIRKDGSRFWASVVITRIVDEDGTLLGFSKVTRDLTQRKEAEEALKKSEAKLRKIFNVGLIGMALRDVSGKIREANDFYLSLIGYSREELGAGRIRWTELTPPEYRALDEAATHQAFRIGASDIFQKEYVRKDGTRVPVLIGVSLMDRATGEMVAVVADLTSQVAARKTLEMALKARDEFISIASHELKTPITSMTMQTQLLMKSIAKDGTVDPNRLSRTMETFTRQLVRLNRLVEDMLDISRIATGRLSVDYEDVELASLLNEVTERYRPQASAAGCELSVAVEPGVRCHWDRFRIEQVIGNLITNGIKYGAGKPIEIRSRRLPGDRVEIAVRDHGIGIARKDLERIFGRFERAVPGSSVSGLGLGLYITREILKIHDGSIEVESEPGKGSDFKVLLPLYPGLKRRPAHGAA